MPAFFHLVTNGHFQGDFVYKLYILSTFSNMSVWSLFDKRSAMNNFVEPWTTLRWKSISKSFKKYIFTIFFFPLSLHRTTKKVLTFIKATVHTLFISITCALFNVDWLTNLQGRVNFNNLSLIKLCLACAKQNLTVKTANDACLL